MRAPHPFIRRVWGITFGLAAVIFLQQLAAAAQGLVGDLPGGCRCELLNMAQKAAMHVVLRTSVYTAVLIAFAGLCWTLSTERRATLISSNKGNLRRTRRYVRAILNSKLGILMLAPFLVYLVGAATVLWLVPDTGMTEADWRIQQVLDRGELLGLSAIQAEALVDSFPSEPCVMRSVYVNGHSGALMGEMVDPLTHYRWYGWGCAEIEFDDAEKISSYRICLAGHPFDVYSNAIGSKLEALHFVMFGKLYSGGQTRLERLLALLS